MPTFQKKRKKKREKFSIKALISFFFFLILEFNIHSSKSNKFLIQFIDAMIKYLNTKHSKKMQLLFTSKIGFSVKVSVASA